MYQITDTLYVGNILEAERPPAHIDAVLLVAEEFTPNAPAGVIYERIPLKEFGEAKPALNQAIDWIARHPSGQACDGLLQGRNGPFSVRCHGLSLLRPENGVPGCLPTDHESPAGSLSASQHPSNH